MLSKVATLTLCSIILPDIALSITSALSLEDEKALSIGLSRDRILLCDGSLTHLTALLSSLELKNGEVCRTIGEDCRWGVGALAMMGEDCLAMGAASLSTLDINGEPSRITDPMVARIRGV
jgi:hypothetical protein